MTVTLYHNPNCGTSRNVLALLRERGVEPVIVEYLKTPLALAELKSLTMRMQAPVRDLLRAKEKLYLEMGLDDAKWSDGDLLEQVAKHPILMNRPVVATGDRAMLCRPAERVLDFLEEQPAASGAKA